LVALAVDTQGHELRELTERYPIEEHQRIGRPAEPDSRVSPSKTRPDLRRIDIAAAEGPLLRPAARIQELRYLMVARAALLRAPSHGRCSIPRSNDAHYAALRQVLRTSNRALILNHHEGPDRMIAVSDDPSTSDVLQLS